MYILNFNFWHTVKKQKIKEECLEKSMAIILELSIDHYSGAAVHVLTTYE